MDNIFECDAPRSKGRKQGLINTRLIIYILGVLVLVEAGLFALCAGVSLLYEEPDYIYFVQTMGINIALGGSMVLVGKRTDNLISRRDGYCMSVCRGCCLRHWGCCLFTLADTFLLWQMLFLRPCLVSPLQERPSWTTSSHYPMGCCSGAA